MKNEPKVIHISSTAIIAAIMGLVLIISMLTGTFPMICFLAIGVIIGYFRPIKSTSQLTDIKEFLDRKDNYYTYSTEEIRPDLPNVKAPKEDPEEKEESKDVSK